MDLPVKDPQTGPSAAMSLGHQFSQMRTNAVSGKLAPTYIGSLNITDHCPARRTPGPKHSFAK